MKSRVLLLLLLFQTDLMAQPVRIHSHNDYRQSKPVWEALAQQVYSLEVDIFLYQGQLKVAHDEAELPAAPLLDSLYLQPLQAWFSLRTIQDSNYFPYLLIDIKANSEAVLPALIKLLGQYPTLFHPASLQVVISGDRGPNSGWVQQPDYILFDGRPDEWYDPATMKKVAFISDSYNKYARSSGRKIIKLAGQVHHSGKLLRVWGIPDHPGSWKKMKERGVDIINTDQVRACRKYFTL